MATGLKLMRKLTEMVAIEPIFRTLLEQIGEDPLRDGLRETPMRAAKAWEFLTKGYQESVDQIVGDAVFSSACDEMVIVKNIELFSLCEHHLLPFIGKAHVGYIPQGKIIGLSKIARIVELYSRRLQVQENLTQEIAKTLMQAVDAKGVGVIIEAKHLCMMMRGVEKQNSVMTTSAMLGIFRKRQETRNEFLTLVNSQTA